MERSYRRYLIKRTEERIKELEKVAEQKNSSIFTPRKRAMIEDTLELNKFYYKCLAGKPYPKFQ